VKQIPYELLIGWRYTRAGRSTRRNGFISFISGVSMLGIALGVAALIIVLSVMNGFQKEVRDRMLSVVSHIEIYAAGGNALANPAQTLLEAKSHPQVIGAAPFIAAQALMARGEEMKGALVRGIDPALEHEVTDMAQGPQQQLLSQLIPGSFGVVLGNELARNMGVVAGDKVTLIAPSGQITPAGVVSTLAGGGAGAFGYTNGIAASFDQPSGVAVDSNGNVYVADTVNNAIRIILP
jgi:lipoprotein-releasing system permease protein